MRRAIALVMAALLALSVVATVIMYTTRAYAMEEAERFGVITLADDPDKMPIRIGLMYGSNVTVGFEVTAPYGFVVNRVLTSDPSLAAEPIWELEIGKVSAAVDANLSKSAMTYSVTSSANAVIGGWHVDLAGELTKSGTETLIASVSPALAQTGVYAIPCYIDGAYHVRAGHFGSRESAEGLIEKLSPSLPGLSMTPVGPSGTAVTVLDPMTDRVLFEYDDRDATNLGFTARTSPTGEPEYLITPAQKEYDGVFTFIRHRDGNIDGVALTDIIPLGEYIKGVLPYEILNTWPIEAQKAFAICARSFTLSGVNRHERAYGIDLCNSSHCQVYQGRARINELVEQAVRETAGQVMVYDGEIAVGYYSAVAGGCTVSLIDCWGYTASPYLVAVETPWEDYAEHSYGVWSAEVTPAELCASLRAAGYTSLRGSIADISVDELAENSTYVKQITFTDIYGTKATVRNTDNIRIALSDFCKSANFVVGRGSVKTTEAVFDSDEGVPAVVRTGGGTFTRTGTSLPVLTGSGKVSRNLPSAYVLVGRALLPLAPEYPYQKTVTVTAENPSNFVFAGKGWGHGVGLSQMGAMQYARIGASAETILKAYFTGVEIVDYRTLSH